VLFKGGIVEATYRVSVGDGQIVTMSGDPDKIDEILVLMVASRSPVPTLDHILELAAKLPSGLDDPKAADKLLAERDELLEAMADGDIAGSLTELADAVYYAAKHIDWATRRVSELLGVTVEDALRVTVAKYSLRAVERNPKDDEAEREACLAAVS
jgi:hypothetical protein